MKKRLIGVVLAGILAISSVLPVCAEEVFSPYEDEIIESNLIDKTELDFVQDQKDDDIASLLYVKKNPYPYDNPEGYYLEVGYALGKIFDKTGVRKYHTELNGIASSESEMNTENSGVWNYQATLFHAYEGEARSIVNGDNTYKFYIDKDLIFTVKFNVTLGNDTYTEKYQQKKCKSLENINSYSFTVNYGHENNNDDNNNDNVDLPFTDVPANAWYYNAVKYVYDNKIMSGTSSSNFAPNATTTREMMVTIVYNAAGKPATEYNGRFTDVPNGKWFSTAVSWAVNNGITSGKSDNMFGVGENVTREQVAVFLYNFAKNQGKDVSAQADLSKYSDSALVSSWAKTAIAWANANGVINGSNGKLNPKGNATRAEIATMIMNYMK